MSGIRFVTKGPGSGSEDALTPLEMKLIERVRAKGPTTEYGLTLEHWPRSTAHSLLESLVSKGLLWKDEYFYYLTAKADLVKCYHFLSGQFGLDMKDGGIRAMNVGHGTVQFQTSNATGPLAPGSPTHFKQGPGSLRLSRASGSPIIYVERKKPSAVKKYKF